MRTLLAFLLCVASVAASPDSLMVRISRHDRMTQVSMQGREMPTEGIRSNLVHVAAYSTNIYVFVGVDTNVSASELVDTLALIKSTRLTKVNLIVEGQKDGRRGNHQLPITLDRRPIYYCLGVEGGDFIPFKDRGTQPGVTDGSQQDTTPETMLQIPDESFSRVLARARTKVRVRGFAEGAIIGFITGVLMALFVVHARGRDRTKSADRSLTQ